MVGPAGGGRAAGGLRGSAEGCSRRGDRVRVRVATLGDLGGLGEMFSRSSRETIYRRFRMPYPVVPGWMLAHLLDPGRHGGEALVAVAGGEIVGHAMYGRPEGGEAEVGVVVEDGRQARGVGRLLFSGLAAGARARGIEAFVCSNPEENRGTIVLGSPKRTEARPGNVEVTRRSRVPAPGFAAFPSATGANG